MKVSGTHARGKRRIVNPNSTTNELGHQPSQAFTSVETGSDEMLMKYYTLKNIITSLNDDVKDIKHKYVNMDTLKDYNDTISAQLSEMIIENTPRDNSSTITFLKEEMENIKKLLNKQHEEDDSDEETKYECLVSTVECLASDVRTLANRIEALEARELYSDKPQIPKLIIKRKEQKK